jgi:hypothetical protein
LQTVSQRPQWFTSLIKSAHDAPHAALPSAQLALHAPFAHTIPPSQAVSHLPQCRPSSSSETHSSPQRLSGVEQRMVQVSPRQMPWPLPRLGAGQFITQALHVPSTQLSPFAHSLSEQQPLSATQPLAHDFWLAVHPSWLEDPAAPVPLVPAVGPVAVPPVAVAPPSVSPRNVCDGDEHPPPSAPKLNATTAPRATHVIRAILLPSKRTRV